VITEARDITISDVAPRQPGDPKPDLIDYRVVHRAMTVDLNRLATAAAELVGRPDRARMAALRSYLEGVSGEIVSHHQVEDEAVWALLEAVAGELTPLAPLTDDHERLDPLLRRAVALADLQRPTPELATVLREVAELLARHVDDEERLVFPLLEGCVRVEDYQKLQKRFRANVRPRLLPFLVPWAIRHATPEERPELLSSAGWLMRALLVLFERRFRAREALLFGPAGSPTSPDDRAPVPCRLKTSHTTNPLLRGES
jgi:iron-sulfur cluster repair protein YtfE (RIC family)